MFEDQEGRGGNASGSNRDSAKGKGKNSKPLEPPLKRSVKGDSKSPLPPPLTSTPLPAFSSSISNQNSAASRSTPSTLQSPALESKPRPEVKEEQMVIDISTPSQPPVTPTVSTTVQKQETGALSSQQTTSATNPHVPTIPSDMNMRVPIVIGPTSPSSTTSEPSSSKTSSTFDLNSPPISLQRDTIILNPAIFSSLTPEQLKELEALGAKKAIEILQSYIVRFLKERIKTEGAKAKGKKKKDKSSKKKDASVKEDGSGSGVADGASTKAKSKPDASTTPFTTAPLPLRKAAPPSGSNGVTSAAHSSTSPGLSTAMTPLRISSPPMSSLNDPQNEEIDIMGDDEPPSKKARFDVAEVLG